MSFIQKLNGLAHLPFVTRIVDQIKNTSKKQFAIAFSSVALAAASITAFAVFPTVQNSTDSVSVLSPSQFVVEAEDNGLLPTAFISSRLVSTGTLSHKSGGGNSADGVIAGKPIKLTLSETKKTFKKLKDALTLKPTLSKTGITAKYKWESSDKSVATVDKNGKVKPKMNGTATITCTEKNTKTTAKCVITVDTVQVSSLKLSKSSLTLSPDKTATIKATVKSDDAANKKLKWKSSDEKVAKVNSKGKVEAVSPGNATISCSTTDGSKITKKCKVTVKDPSLLDKISLNYIDIQFCGLGCTEQLTLLEYFPETAANTAVTWTTTNEAVAVVDEYGIVYPVDNGQCEIIATAVDGSGATASCPVTVSGVVDYVETAPNYEVVIPDNIDINETANSVVEEAEKYVGWLPYVWGGTDLTSGVDCSGFICAVYEKFGINLWGIRTDLIYAGREVSLEEAKPGDIIVYSGHVAIYDGYGGKIHAPTEGYMVTHDYGIGNYRSIRRVIE
ncbi:MULTISPECIES: Ig-like domain-containing protein [unclassified Ruminococcus]|uniref:Ig-like domain-containing protein n=1 Tax=unclassified Ruminococcus TaxID=2608920 RepID=UPI00210A1DC6|nr:MULTISPECIES: Ig-like domain-containing protein [unclassified Ruminococcus]